MTSLSGGKHIVFFSRGKGRGHAVPDAAIARELLALEPDLQISFVSYSVGALTLKELGHEVVDLNLPEDNPTWETAVRVGKLLAVLREHAGEAVIVSHEEFCTMPMAKVFGYRTVFLTDWFMPAEAENMKCLQYADEVIFIDDPAIWDEPPYLSGKVSYVGTVLRELCPRAKDRSERRAQLGLPGDGVMILVSPGGADMHTEARAPIFDLVLAAHGLLTGPEKRLVWVAGGADYDLIRGKSAGRGDVTVLAPHYDFTPTLVASDIVITKGNRLPLLECEALGIPSISISYGYNPIDDYRIGRIRTNVALRARGLDPNVLAAHMSEALEAAGSLRQKAPEKVSFGRLSAAKRLQAIINSPA